MADRDRPAAYDASAEVLAMQRKERKRWLTVAEAQALRKTWADVTKAMDGMCEKFDADPETEVSAVLFVILSTLAVAGFTQQASTANMKLTSLIEEGLDAG